MKMTDKDTENGLNGEEVEVPPECNQCGEDKELVDDDAFGRGFNKWSCTNPDCISNQRV